MAEDWVEQIRECKIHKEDDASAEPSRTWLLFAINKRLFAVPSDEIKEILKDFEVFPVPFVPPYVKGVLNRYGDPYVVVDPALLLGEEEQNAALFVVLNDASNTCLKITDIQDFYSAPETNVVQFSETAMSDFFDGTLHADGREALVINIKSFFKKVGADFAVQ
ncbi:chemotaxis protein CheW [Treponema brennaborense]|uniref:CheW protein n=1 Tax=Treponema brennaborense (strain DSM 12168 / CIP 105900 / DD5/3) TaxID=906968 RepID=F4LNT4_TREBD|nr:chemotaxis protein CheW [Treponema brennaborense]AEE16919.1 CheW protein [Treponema brennaborense DSM 12168]